MATPTVLRCFTSRFLSRPGNVTILSQNNRACSYSHFTLGFFTMYRRLHQGMKLAHEQERVSIPRPLRTGETQQSCRFARARLQQKRAVQLHRRVARCRGTGSSRRQGRLEMFYYIHQTSLVSTKFPIPRLPKKIPQIPQSKSPNHTTDGISKQFFCSH